MTIDRLEEILKLLSKKIFYFKDEKIYGDVNIKFLFKAVEEIEDGINEINEWLKDYKYKITKDVEIGEVK